jgi:hypothetical protein
MTEPSRTPAVGVAEPPRSTPVRVAADRSAVPRRSAPITFRSLLIGFALVPVNSLWIVQTEVVRYAGHPTTTSLYFNVIFCLFVLIGLNGLVRRLAPSWALQQGELLVVYTILSLGSCMVGHDMLQVFVATLVHPFYFASDSNNWASLFFPALPRWLMMDDPDAVRAYHLGNTSLYHAHYLLAWLRPVLIWTAFFSVLIFMMLCLNTILRRQWSEHERLTFPIVVLPFEMTAAGGAFYRNRLMWMGFALAGLLVSMNSLNRNYPSVPSLPLREINLQTYIIDAPWNAIGGTPLQILPFVIGLGFLLPLDLSFSCWFFYLYWKAQAVISAAYGWNQGRPDFPYIPEQSAGAFLGVAVFVIWIGRRFWGQVLRQAFTRERPLDDRHEPMSYRGAVWGFLAGFAALVVFSVYLGIPIGMAIVFMLIYFALSLSVDRMRAEFGSPAHDLHHAGPDQIISEVVGVRSLEVRTMTAFALFAGFNRAYRSHPMPHQLEGFRLATLSGVSTRPLLWVMLAAGVWGTLCAFWALLHVYYVLGAATAKIAVPGVPTIFGWEPYRRLEGWIESPQMRDPLETQFLVGGFLFSLFLMVMRGNFLWWPFHPVGLAVSSSWAMGYMWFPILIAWLLKRVILRGGGLQGYRTAVPFFLGLVLGEFVVGSIWNILGIVFQFEIYKFWG